MLPLIPESRQAAVARALREAFGVDEFEEIKPLTSGLSSALVFRIVVGGTPHVLRVIMRTDEMGDPTRQFACMKIGSNARIAPRIRYTSIADRISITDFAEARPWPAHPAPLLAATIRRLHSLPRFPWLMNYFDRMEGFIRRFQEAQVLPEKATADLFRLYDSLARVYPRNDPDQVPSHNDLKPENIIFDGDQVWLIDWEAAFLNDRYVDLAVAANFFVKDESEVEAYVQLYFGEPPGDYRRARFFLMQQAMHVFYTVTFMLFTSRRPVDPNLTAPEFREFHEQILSGQATFADDDARLVYAKVHLNEALRNMRTERFEDALARVADYRAGASGSRSEASSAAPEFKSAK